MCDIQYFHQTKNGRFQAPCSIGSIARDWSVQVRDVLTSKYSRSGEGGEKASGLFVEKNGPKIGEKFQKFVFFALFSE